MFVAYFRDGSTVSESSISWDDLPNKDQIVRLGLLDPDSVQGLDAGEHRCFFFQYKHGWMGSGGVSRLNIAQTIGMVTSREGDCICIETKDGKFRRFETTLKKMTLNLNLYPYIHLDEVV